MREAVLLTLGVLTPIGILAVNESAFVMGHLTQFIFEVVAQQELGVHQPAAKVDQAED